MCSWLCVGAGLQQTLASLQIALCRCGFTAQITKEYYNGRAKFHLPTCTIWRRSRVSISRKKNCCHFPLIIVKIRPTKGTTLFVTWQKCTDPTYSIHNAAWCGIGMSCWWVPRDIISRVYLSPRYRLKLNQGRIDPNFGKDFPADSRFVI